MRLSRKHNRSTESRRNVGAGGRRAFSRAAARGFTMVEIAIALGIIAFALVAIIGILPAGLQLQKQTRERSIIDKDAAFWINAIRHGEDYLHAFTNGYVSGDDVYQFIDSVNGVDGPFYSTASIIGQLSKTNGLLWYDNSGGRHLALEDPNSAIVRPFNSPAVDRSDVYHDFAFKYRMNVHITPSISIRLDHPDFDALQSKQWEVKLEFAWPVINGRAVLTQAVYRTTLTGDAQVYVHPVRGPFWYIDP